MNNEQLTYQQLKDDLKEAKEKGTDNLKATIENNLNLFFENNKNSDENYKWCWLANKENMEKRLKKKELTVEVITNTLAFILTELTSQELEKRNEQKTNNP